MSRPKAEMSVEQKENGQIVEYVAYPYVEYDHVTFENGMQIEKALEDDVAMPTVTHEASSFKVGQGDSDVSDSIVDSSVASMSIKGQTYQNILPSPTLRNSMTDGNTMQKINEGYDSVEVVDGNVKSAILSGKTLVNLIDKNKSSTKPLFSSATVYRTTTLNGEECVLINGNYINCIDLINPPKGDFTIKCRASLTSEQYSCFQFVVHYEDGTYFKSERKLTTSIDKLVDIEWYHNPTKTVTGIALDSSGTHAAYVDINKFVVVEGNYMNNLSYFEGMTSVKLPVLTTRNNNIFHGDMGIGCIQDNGSITTVGGFSNYRYTIEFFDIQKHKEFYITQFSNTNHNGYVIEYDENFNIITRSYGLNYKQTPYQIKNNNTKYVRLNYASDVTEIVIGFAPIIATTYKPYKTNILTVNEDVTLRSNGSVYDELDCLTGKLTQKLKMYTVDKDSPFTYGGSNSELCQTLIAITLDDSLKNSPMRLVSDKLPYKIPNYDVANGLGVELKADGRVFIVIPVADHLDIKGWLADNPITFLYPTETPAIKTVDLSILDQDNQPVEQLQSYANGHIQLSSNVAEGEYSLTPSIEYEVPTSNSYYVDLAKPSTQYTMKNMQGTFTIDGTQYNASANGTFTTPSTLTNKFMVTSVAQTNAMMLEGDMTSEKVPYVEGIKSAFEGADKVEIVSQNADNTLTNTTSFPITNPLRSLPNGVRDEIVLDRMSNKAKLIQRVGEDLTQLPSPIVTRVDIEGFPYVYKDGHIFLNTEVAPTTEVKYSINQSQIIESQSEDIVRHSKEIDNLYNLIATYVQVNYDSTLLNLKTKGV